MFPLKVMKVKQARLIIVPRVWCEGGGTMNKLCILCPYSEFMP